MLQSHKHLSLDQKRNLTPPQPVGVQIRFSHPTHTSRTRPFIQHIFKLQWPKHAEDFATLQPTRICSYKSFHTNSLAYHTFFQKSPLAERQRLTAWLCWSYFCWQQWVIRDSSWGLFQGYFVSQLPNGGGKQKEDHLQGPTASGCHVKHPRLYPCPLEGIIHLERISQKD